MSRRPKGPGARHLPCGPQLPSCGPLDFPGPGGPPRRASDGTWTRPAGAAHPANKQGRWVAPPALTMPHAVRNFSSEGITRAITTVYYQPGRYGNLHAAAVFPGSPTARAMTGILALGCFVTGFIVAWLLRTGYVMTQISWAQERMEDRVRYWQGEAMHARAVAEHLLRQLEASTGR